MARRARIHVPGGVYHVILRGNGGQDIFFEDADRDRVYLLLQEGVERFGHRIHGFCLMTHQLHLAVEVREVPLSKIMQNVAFRYTRWVNKRQGRMGHLFQGRYKAIVVDAYGYLMELIRYIHLNPVRAGLVRHPEEYPWTGHRAYLGEETLPWLSTEWCWDSSASAGGPAARYERFVKDGYSEGHRSEFHSGEEDSRVLGPDRFLEKILGSAAAPAHKRPALGTLVRRVCRAYGVKESDLMAPGRRRDLAEARALVGYLAMVLGSAALTAVGKHFGRDVATLSNGVRRLSEKCRAGKVSAPARQVLDEFVGGE